MAQKNHRKSKIIHKKKQDPTRLFLFCSPQQTRRETWSNKLIQKLKSDVAVFSGREFAITTAGCSLANVVSEFSRRYFARPVSLILAFLLAHDVTRHALVTPTRNLIMEQYQTWSRSKLFSVCPSHARSCCIISEYSVSVRNVFIFFILLFSFSLYTRRECTHAQYNESRIRLVGP